MPLDARDLPKSHFLISDVYIAFYNKEEAFSPFCIPAILSPKEPFMKGCVCVCGCCSGVVTMSTHGMPLRETYMRIMQSQFGLCFRPGMGPVKLFIIKLVSVS